MREKERSFAWVLLSLFAVAWLGCLSVDREAGGLVCNLLALGSNEALVRGPCEDGLGIALISAYALCSDVTEQGGCLASLLSGLTLNLSPLLTISLSHSHTLSHTVSLSPLFLSHPLSHSPASALTLSLYGFTMGFQKYERNQACESDEETPFFVR